MKKTYILWSLLSLAFYPSEQAAEDVRHPKEVIELTQKKDYLIKNIELKYIKALQLLKVKYTKKGDLDEALLVKELIKDAQLKCSNFSEEKKNISNSVVGKKWSWEAKHNDNRTEWIILAKNGIIRSNWLDSGSSKWEKIDENKIKIIQNWKGKKIHSILTWNVDYTAYRSTGLYVPGRPVSGVELTK